MTIPARLHVCWIGPALPWTAAFAILSAAERAELPEIVLHHTDALDPGGPLDAVARAPGVQLSRLDPVLLLEQAGRALRLGDALALLYRRLADPAMRSDILRAAILHSNGGLYADLDTVTVASLRPLLDTPCLVASERIVWPAAARASRSPIVLARHLSLDLLRKAGRAMPHGWHPFRRLEPLYVRAVTNAVMGAEAGAPAFAAYLRAMAAVPAGRPLGRTALGPQLLATVIRDHADVAILPPHVTAPLPPEISAHWFRRVRRPGLAAMLRPETRIVHWYASVRTRTDLSAIDPAWVRAHADRQPYAALVSTSIRDLPAGA